MTTLPDSHDFFLYQGRVNHDVESVASHKVICKRQQASQTDYRAEVEPNPVPSLQDREKDNTDIARTKSSDGAPGPTDDTPFFTAAPGPRVVPGL